MKNEFFYPSKDGITQIHAIEWSPEQKPIAVVQMCHGMVEYIDRYREFAEFLCGHGFYVVGHDHLGHGKSVVGPEKLGYFHEGNGNDFVIGDIHTLRTMSQAKYPDVPYFMLGHSMGSFLLRQYLGTYGMGLSGAMIVGSGDQPDAIIGIAKMICKSMAAFKGWEYRSGFMNQLTIGNYEKKFGKAWLSRNPENVKTYNDDPLCGFIFTLNAFYGMFTGISRMNAQEKSGKIPKNLPVLFMSGQEDPVGDYGNGVKKVHRRYLEQGVQDAALKLYPEDRHEILNELDRQTVYQDVLAWLQSKSILSASMA